MFGNDKNAAKRLAICFECESFYKPTRQCKECGCFMKVKTRIPSAKCPLEKW